MKRIVQIELTNVCNRRCSYCGITVMKRKQGFMSQDTFDHCLAVLTTLDQDMVGLHHFGESTLHQDFIKRIRQMNALGIRPFINTNGDYLTDKMIGDLAGLEIQHLVISGHMPEPDRVALWSRCHDGGIRNSFWQRTLDDKNTLSLAGQLPHIAANQDQKPLIDPMAHCRFLVEDQAVVLWDGSLTPCCIDYDGKGVFGNIRDVDVLEQKTPAFSLCATCPGHPGNVIP